MGSLGNAGANKALQCIALVGPWSVLNDDFGPYSLPRGFSKAKFFTVGSGSGYTISIYDSGDPAIDRAIDGVWNAQLSTKINPKPPPLIPVASYGVSCGIPETSWGLTVGAAAQGGTGIEANPLITDGTASQQLISSSVIYYCRAKLTAIAGGATGIVQVWVEAIP